MDELKVDLIEDGDGATFAEDGDVVSANYRGNLASNGEEFDSNEGKPAFKFTVGSGQVIRGFDQGFRKLSKGAKAKLHIPAHLGYGERGYPDPSKESGYAIPPNSDLVFEVELVDISKPMTEQEVVDNWVVDTPNRSHGTGKNKKKKKNTKKKKN